MANLRTLEGVLLPSSLENLTFGLCFDQPLNDQLVLPAKLQSLTFGSGFNQPLDAMAFQDGRDGVLCFGRVKYGFVSSCFFARKYTPEVQKVVSCRYLSAKQRW